MTETEQRKRSHIVLFTISVIVCFSIAIGYKKSSGIFFIYFQDSFQTSASQTSLIFSLTTTSMFLGGPFYGALFKSIGSKLTLLTAFFLIFASYIGIYFSYSLIMAILCYSVINGMGTGLAHIAGFTIVGQVFGKKRTLVTNMLQLFSNLSAMACASGFQSMMDHYTWRDVMLIMGAIALNGLPFGWLGGKYYYILMSQVGDSPDDSITEEKLEIKNSTNELNAVNKPDETGCGLLLKSASRIFEASLLDDVWFWLFCLSCIGTLGYRHLFSQFFIRYAQDIGIEKQAAANLYTIYLAHSLVFTISMGLLTSTSKDKMFCNIKPPRTATIVIVATGTLTLIQLIPVIWEHYTGFLVYAVLCGILDGCIGTLPLCLIPLYFGEERIAGALGFRSFTTGLYNLGLPPFIGYLIDVFGTYKPSLIACSILNFIGAAALLSVELKTLQKIKKKELTKNEEIVSHV